MLFNVYNQKIISTVFSRVQFDLALEHAGGAGELSDVKKIVFMLCKMMKQVTLSPPSGALLSPAGKSNAGLLKGKARTDNINMGELYFISLYNMLEELVKS